VLWKMVFLNVNWDVKSSKFKFTKFPKIQKVVCIPV
jgi:hypothetical protein